MPTRHEVGCRDRRLANRAVRPKAPGADDLQAGLDTVREANEAARRVREDQEEIDDDPNNLDRSR